MLKTNLLSMISIDTQRVSMILLLQLILFAIYVFRMANDMFVPSQIQNLWMQ